MVEIAGCGDSLCGRIAGMRDPLGPDGKRQHDFAGRPKCGLVILDRAEPTEDGEYHAKITNPDDGRMWNCVFSVASDGTLHLRGYVLFRLLGETEVWTHYHGQIGGDCRMG